MRLRKQIINGFEFLDMSEWSRFSNATVKSPQKIKDRKQTICDFHCLGNLWKSTPPPVNNWLYRVHNLPNYLNHTTTLSITNEKNPLSHLIITPI